MQSALNIFCLVFSLILLSAGIANAHVSEQGFVLLLPTGVYITSGLIAVIASLLIVSITPSNITAKLFKPVTIKASKYLFIFQNKVFQTTTSLISLITILALILIGLFGTRDPLLNLLPLAIWTFWWIGLVIAHAIFGNIWAAINPWTGLYNILARFIKTTKPNLPNWVGIWPAVNLFILFYLFVIADLAPDDPERLAKFILLYLIFTFSGMIVFGESTWLRRCECFTIFFSFIAKLSPVKFTPTEGVIQIGLPAWQAIRSNQISFTQSVFILTILASGSFDGLNETFWWLDKNGINPLAFPGRSAVIIPSVLGMIFANLLLYCIFAICIWFGIKLANQNSCTKHVNFSEAFCLVAISFLPIAVAYHSSHYLVPLLVNQQYLFLALSDPLLNGANLLGLENYEVTTGFLNAHDSVERIWLSQATIIVIGHILAVLMTHNACEKLYANRRQALLFHIPVAIFVSFYTWFGLWLLASPKGV